MGKSTEGSVSVSIPEMLVRPFSQKCVAVLGNVKSDPRKL